MSFVSVLDDLILCDNIKFRLLVLLNGHGNVIYLNNSFNYYTQIDIVIYNLYFRNQTLIDK